MAPALDRFVTLLIDRHNLSPQDATGIVRRAAQRKGVTMHDIASLVVDQVPLPVRSVAA